MAELTVERSSFRREWILRFENGSCAYYLDGDIHLTVQAESGEVQLHLEEVTGPGEERLHLEFFMDPEDALAVSAVLTEASISAQALKDAETPRPN